jgi:hypothetical protein
MEMNLHIHRKASPHSCSFLSKEDIYQNCNQATDQSHRHIGRGKMSKLLERAFTAEITLRQKLITFQQNFFTRLKDDRGDVPGWVLVVLMTTGLVTAIWTIAAPRLTAILKNSLDSMNGIR